MTDVFISYASEDRERAAELARALGALGWSVWWDRKIIAGQAFDHAIERELEAAKSVVVLWSTHSIASEWVKNEAAFASERGVLVPAIIESVKLPLEFRRKQTADLIGWRGEASHGGFQALDRSTVRVSSDYQRLGTVDVTLTRIDNKILNADGDTPFMVDLDRDPPTVLFDPRSELAYRGNRQP